MAHEMPPRSCAEGGDLRDGLLHAALTHIGHTGGDHLADPRELDTFGHRNEDDLFWPAARPSGRSGDARPHPGHLPGDLTHEASLLLCPGGCGGAMIAAIRPVTRSRR